MAAASIVLDNLTLWQAKSIPAAWQSAGAAVAAQIIAAHGQMTPGMTQDQSWGLLWEAVHATEWFGFGNWTDRATFSKSVITALTGSEPAWYVSAASDLVAWDCVHAAQDFVSQGNYTAALQQISDPTLLMSGQWCHWIVAETAQIKTITRSNDALSWAKAAYLLGPFSDTQEDINTVTAALRSADLNLTRANAFIAAQADATQPNVLTGLALPAVFGSAPLPMPAYANVNAVLQGNNVAALKAAQAAYLAAGSNDQINAAVSEMAQTLRDVDLNLVRANAYVAAQKAGTPFDITELD